MTSETMVLDDKQASELFTHGTLENVIAFYRAHGDNFRLAFANSNPLHYAAENKNPLILLYLLKHQNLRLRVNDENGTNTRPLEISVYKGLLKNVEILIYYGADEKLPLKLGGTVANTLAAVCLLSDPDKQINEFKVARENNKPLLEEAQLDKEITRINAQLSKQNSKPTNKNLITQLTCSFSYWLNSMRQPCPSSSEISTENVPLVIKKHA